MARPTTAHYGWSTPQLNGLDPNDPPGDFKALADQVDVDLAGLEAAPLPLIWTDTAGGPTFQPNNNGTGNPITFTLPKPCRGILLYDVYATLFGAAATIWIGLRVDGTDRIIGGAVNGSGSVSRRTVLDFAAGAHTVQHRWATGEGVPVAFGETRATILFGQAL